MREISERFGLAVDPRATVEDITVGQQQRVEILKALYRNADILVLDEPTAVLTPQEARELFEIIRSLTEQGKSIIFISHKLNEVTEIADRITVLRRGKLIETLPAAGATEESLARLMVGRDVLLRVEKGASHPAEPLLQVEDLHVFDDREIEKVRGVSFEVRAGEIVGIAGIDGNGQTELIDAPQRPAQDRRGHGHARRRRRHERRRLRPLRRRPRAHARGPAAPRARARVLDRREPRPARLPPASRTRGSGGCSRAGCSTAPRRLIKEFDVRGGGPSTPRGALSGGNQQKVVLAREIDRNPRVLIAAQPTRGLDVGAIEFVHRRLVAERDEGEAILLVSLELEEILSLSDRILVMYEGEIVGEFPPTATEEELGVAMTGGGAGRRWRHERADARAADARRPGPRDPRGEAVADGRYQVAQKAGGCSRRC